MGARRLLSRSSVILAGLVALAALPAPALGSAFPGTNGKLVYTQSPETSPSVLYTANPDGGSPAQIPAQTGATDDQARFSADGTMIVFLRQGSGFDQIWTSNAAGTSESNLSLHYTLPTSTFPASPAFSPDGTKIVFELDNVNMSQGIYQVNSDGTGFKQLTTGVDYTPTFSPDGTKIAFVHVTNNFANYEIDVGGYADDTVTAPSAIMSGTLSLANPDFSPDGTQVAYDKAGASGTRNIFVVSAAGGGMPTQLTSNTALADMDTHPAFSPDGTKIATEHQVGSTGDTSINVMNANGSSETAVVNPGGTTFELNPDWACASSCLRTPLLSAIETSALSYTSGSSPAPVTSGLTVADAGSSTLVGAAIRITSGYTTSEDSLSFTNQNGITGSWDTTNGVLTLSGTASLASYQAALRSIGYTDSNIQNPSTAPRLISFQVNDGASASGTVNRQVNVSAPYTPPSVATAAPSGTTATSATFNGTINPNGTNVSSCVFEYATSDTYSNSHTINCDQNGSIGSGTSPVHVSATTPSAALTPSTIYYVRLVVPTGGAPISGGNWAFQTDAKTSPPIIDACGVSPPVGYQLPWWPTGLIELGYIDTQIVGSDTADVQFNIVGGPSSAVYKTTTPGKLTLLGMYESEQTRPTTTVSAFGPGDPGVSATSWHGLNYNTTYGYTITAWNSHGKTNSSHVCFFETPVKAGWPASPLVSQVTVTPDIATPSSTAPPSGPVVQPVTCPTGGCSATVTPIVPPVQPGPGPSGPTTTQTCDTSTDYAWLEANCAAFFNGTAHARDVPASAAAGPHALILGRTVLRHIKKGRVAIRVSFSKAGRRAILKHAHHGQLYIYVVTQLQIPHHATQLKLSLVTIHVGKGR